jgi:hypothetical protein
MDHKVAIKRTNTMQHCNQSAELLKTRLTQGKVGLNTNSNCLQDEISLWTLNPKEFNARSFNS